MILENKIKAIKEPKSYGNLTLNSADFPAVANLKLGDNQKFEITVSVTALRNPDRWEISEKKANPKDVIASVSITKISIEEKNEKE